MTRDNFFVLLSTVARYEGPGLSSEISLSSIELDSLQLFELVVALEDATGVFIDESDVPQRDVTLGELYDLLLGKTRYEV
jgi:acyl carrier protein